MYYYVLNNVLKFKNVCPIHLLLIMNKKNMLKLMSFIVWYKPITEFMTRVKVKCEVN